MKDGSDGDRNCVFSFCLPQSYGQRKVGEDSGDGQTLQTPYILESDLGPDLLQGECGTTGLCPPEAQFHRPKNPISLPDLLAGHLQHLGQGLPYSSESDAPVTGDGMGC